ncbi:hypothetical protein [Streptomyces sp. NPDC001515]
MNPRRGGRDDAAPPTLPNRIGSRHVDDLTEEDGSPTRLLTRTAGHPGS